MILIVDSTDDGSQETGGSRKIVESKAEDLDIVRRAHGVVCDALSLMEDVDWRKRSSTATRARVVIPGCSAD
jgi:hypothetical protein